MLPPATSAYADSKPHYLNLDGLRGVAALMVVVFHIFEIFAHGDPTQYIINHAYLAVDFFFLLSGFVIGYAYDDRWGQMSLGQFVKRRLIRLHPMIVMGMIVGAAAFYFGESPKLFAPISETPVWEMLLVMLLGFTLLPLPPSMDIRGWAEMHPLDGPAWTLFFEYIGNILYALLLRRLSHTLLGVLTLLSAGLLAHLALTQGNVVGGWALNAEQLHVGFARLLYPFLAGLLLVRVVRPGRIPYAFLWASLLLIVALSVPHLGGEQAWINGLYEAFIIIVVFPLIVYIGASGQPESRYGTLFTKFLGDLSYPLYITHYPLVYVFMAWVVNNEVPVGKAFPMATLVFAGSVALAYLALKLYDEPVRRWLAARFLPQAPR